MNELKNVGPEKQHKNFLNSDFLESHEVFRHLVQSVKDYAICMLDPEGRIATWNSGAKEFYGYEAQEVLGKGVERFFTSKEVEAGKPLQEITEAKSKGRYVTEGWRVRKDGSRFWAQITITLIHDEQGNLLGLAKVTQDLTEKKRMEKEIQESSEAFRLIIESVKDYAIFMLDPNGYIQTWNRGAEQIKGYKDKEIIGKHFSIFYPIEDIQKGKPEMELREAAKLGRFEDEDWRVRKDNSRFWANVIVTPIRKSDGSLYGFAKITRDLTQRMQLEKEVREARDNLEERVLWATAHLKEAQDRLTLALDFAQMGIFDWDLKSMTANWSEIMKKIYGFNSDEFTGEIDQLKRRIHPKDLPHFEKAIDDVIKGRRDYEIIYRIIWPDKSLRWIFAKGKVQKDEAGRAARFIGTAMDITSGKIIEERERLLGLVSMAFSSNLDFHNTLKTAVLNIVPDFASWVIIDLFENGKIQRHFVHHYDPSKKDTTHRLQQIPPSSLLNFGQNRTLFRTKADGKIDLSLLNTSGSKQLELIQELGISSYIVAQLKLRDKVLGQITFVTSEEVAPFKETDQTFATHFANRAAIAIDNGTLYKSAQDAIRVREEVISIVSHDLRTPLNTIVLNAQLLLRTGLPFDDDKKIRSKVERIDRAAARMRSMIEDLLDISKMEAGNFGIEIHPEDAVSMVHEAIELHSVLAETKQIELKADITGENFSVYCDHQRIMQVFSNLIGNALKFTPEEGRVIVKIRKEDGYAIFSVQDNGPGIPKEQLEQIFERYWQTGTKKKMGAGLGLYIAKGIVEAHAGKIWVESQEEQGSNFFFTIPTKP